MEEYGKPTNMGISSYGAKKDGRAKGQSTTIWKKYRN